MGDASRPNLKAGLARASGSPETAPADPILPPPNATIERIFDGPMAEALKIIPAWTIKRAWFAMAHLLLEPGSRVIDMGCRDGASVYTMAVLAPNMNFIGIDKNPDLIAKANETYKLPNLEFAVADVMDAAVPAGSVDAIICNFLLHEIYSSSDFNQRLVRGAIRTCGTYLKPAGQLFIRDFAEPVGSDDLVLMEMPDTPSRSTKLEELSEPDLLVWYSEYATMQDTAGTSGFYLEELPARFPRTRLFRLPHKWAYEFIMRKDARNKWLDEAPKEYTFFNEREYHKTLNGLGLRVLYSAPHWDDTYIKKHFEKNFRLLDEDGNALGHPSTSFVVLAQKVDQADGLILAERRKAKTQSSQFNVTTYRNDIDGRLIEVVSRNLNTTEIIPFSIMNGNRLVVYLHEGVPRGLVNSVPRGGRNLDGRFWSGHLTEAVSVDTEIVRDIEEKGAGSVVDFMNDTMGLKVSVGQSFVEGPGYYPNPRFIAERVETRFINVEPSMGRYIPEFVRDDITGFASTGAIRAFDAQSILNAISVGALPSGNLEMQLLMLFSMLDIDAVDWADSPLVLKEEEPTTKPQKISDILKKTGKSDKRYKEIRGTTGKIRIEKSIFVDEGIDSEGANKGLAARDVDFAVNEETGMNVAVILPLSKQHSGEVMASVIFDYMPIPERYSGDGSMVSLPTINLPRDIQTVDQAKKYIAEKFEIKLDQVSKMGEPYYSHIGMTPQRIFPFAINCPHSKMATPKHGVTGMTLLKDIGRLHWKDLFERYDIDMLKVCGRANKRMFSQNEMGLNWQWKMPMVPRYAEAPFTTGQVVDMRMPMTGQNIQQPVAPQSGGGRGLDRKMAGEMAGIYGGGIGRAAFAKGRDEKSKTGGAAAGGKAGGGARGSRGFKPKDDPKKPDPNAPQPRQ